MLTSCQTLSRLIKLERVTMKANQNYTGARKKITTYTSTDAKLRRLLYLCSQHHRTMISQANARVSACDIAKLRNSEKQQWINTLSAAETEISWRNTKRLERDEQQQQLCGKRVLLA